MQETFSCRGGLPGIENEAQRLSDVVPKRDGIRQQLPLMCCVLRYNAVLERASEGAGYSVMCQDDSAEQEEKKGGCIFSSPWRLCQYLSEEYNMLFLPSAEHSYACCLAERSRTLHGDPEVHLEVALQRG